MIELDTTQLKKLAAAVRGIKRRIANPSTFTSKLGALLRKQTQKRIRTEKTTPAGEPWRPWSSGYAATRIPGKHSLLIDTRAMVQGIEWRANGDSVEVGSSQPYAGFVTAVRPFVGISDRNATEIEALAIGIMEGILANATASGDAG